jgi:SNF2 family DNA or RNA helicase
MTERQFYNKIEVNNCFVIGCLINIYKQPEKYDDSGLIKISGFSKEHEEVLNSIAKFYIDNNILTDKQFSYVKGCMDYYYRQINEIVMEDRFEEVDNINLIIKEPCKLFIEYNTKEEVIIFRFKYDQTLKDLLKMCNTYWDNDKKYWYLKKEYFNYYQTIVDNIHNTEELKDFEIVYDKSLQQLNITNVEKKIRIFDKGDIICIDLGVRDNYIFQILDNYISDKSFNTKFKIWEIKNISVNKEKLRKFIDIVKTKFDNIKVLSTIKFDDSNELVLKSDNKYLESDLEISCPKGLNYYGFQKGFVDFVNAKIKNNRFNVLLADEMGVGKSISSIALINKLKLKKILIVCPNHLKYNWKDELEKWLIEPLKIQLIKSGKDIDKNNDIFIINYESVIENRKVGKSKGNEIIRENKKFTILNDMEFDLLVMDESHYLSNLRSKRTKALQKLSKNSVHKVALSGTPMKNRPFELFPVLNILRPDIFPNYFQYAKRYCNLQKTPWGYDYKGSSNLKELYQILDSELMLRRLKKEVLKQLPSKTRTFMTISGNISKKYKQIYKELEDTLNTIKKDRDKKSIMSVEEIKEYKKLLKRKELTELEQTRFDDLKLKYENREKFMNLLKNGKTTAFEKIQEARKEAFQCKLKDLVEFIDSTVKQDESCVVFVYHKEAFKTLKERLEHLKINVLGFSGDSNIEERHAQVQRFQEGEGHVFISTLATGSTGITLTRSSVVIIAQVDWSTDVMKQAEDRCLRIGQDKAVSVYYPVLKNSIEVHISNVVKEKINIVDKAIEGVEDDLDTGLSFFQKLLEM